MTTEAMYDFADRQGYQVDYRIMNAARSISVQFQDGSCGICMDPTRFCGDELEQLAHEVGHCECGAFYTETTPFETVGRMERKAEKWAIKKLVPEDELIEQYRQSREPWEIAEHFGVTVAFLQKAAEYYGELHPKTLHL